jgi:ornithine carbamoyltransferase
MAPGYYGLRGRDLLCLTEWDRRDVEAVLDVAGHLKRRFYAGERVTPLLAGRSIGLLFEKHSTRTRVSLEVAAYQLGAQPIYLARDQIQLGRGETVADTARVLSRYLDAIAARVRSHSSLVELARHADIPVLNALSDLSHPMQAIADVFTIREFKGRLRGVKLAFVGDGSDNVLHSLLVVGAMFGMHIAVASPPQLRPNPEILSKARAMAEESGAVIEIVEAPEEAVDGADVVYTDVWVSMGQESEREWRIKLLRPYQVNAKLMERASDRALFMHCLPAHRGEEVTDEVIDGEWSVVWDQAENRLHTEKALLSLLVP